ncbi:hypothetical protein GC176_05015 [bacterium]|nr:hypothetical protein [bacterium]
MRWLIAASLMLFVAPPFAQAAQTDSIKAIKAVGHEGNGNVPALAAVAELQKSSTAADLPALLDAFAGASPLAANYLRNVVEAVADRETAAGHSLPADKLRAVIFDTKLDPRARRLAYEVLLKVDSNVSSEIIPQLLLDPSPEFRRDAVQQLIDRAETIDDKQQKLATFRKAMQGATDEDQVKELAKGIRSLGDDVSLVQHFGFLTDWEIIGPFNNRGLVGFAETYPPEKKIDLDATLEGQLGEVKWDEITTGDEFGVLDIAKTISPYKGAVMYLTTTFDSPATRDVQFRFGTPNAWKIWVNGQYLFGRDEYHRGMAIDQYTVPATLKQGQNVILVKLCQNEQTEDWAQRYQLQFRVSDASGVAVHSAASNRQAAALPQNSQKNLTAQTGGTR